MARRGLIILTGSRTQRGALQDACRRFMSSEGGNKRTLNQPMSAHVMPRSGGMPSFMRLPQTSDPTGLDACFIGVPMDIGTSNRPGTRFGPRQIRQESMLLKGVNGMTKARPFQSIQIADLGDVPINLYSLKKSVKIIREFYSKLLKQGSVIPLTMGGDHTITYPILQAVAEKHGPVALVHVDAHLDTGDHMSGMKIAHGTPFRRCVEEGLLQCDKVYQLGIRGTNYDLSDAEWPKKQGFKVYTADMLWYKSLAPLMEEVRKDLAGQPVYLSFDIDALDPGFAPGTGTMEMGGLMPSQALEIVRGCKGLNLVGCDLVEVSPPYDPQGSTALIGSNLLFEMLCVLPGVN